VTCGGRVTRDVASFVCQDVPTKLFRSEPVRVRLATVLGAARPLVLVDGAYR
jgi:hypothetical protein